MKNAVDDYVNIFATFAGAHDRLYESNTPTRI